MKKEYWNSRTVLITGHEGFLGSWLVKTLLSAQANIVGLDIELNRPHSMLNGLRGQYSGLNVDVADYDKVKSVMDEHQPTVVFHLAAEAIVGRAKNDPVNTFKSNIQGTWNVMEAVRHCPSVEAVVVASSDKAYGTHEQLPYGEDHPLQGRHPYDVSKSCTDLLCQSYHFSYDVPVCITRCGNIFGPGDYNFSRIVPDGIRSALNNEQLKIRSNGTFTRDYIYVEDIVEAYITLAEQMQGKGLAGQAFNFSNEHPISVLDFFKLINEVVGSQRIEPEILNQAQDEIPDQYLCSRKAREVLGWSGQNTLREGITKTVDWYRQFTNLQERNTCEF